MSYLSHNKRQKKVCLCRVWIRLTTAYLLCAREFRQNNVLRFNFDACPMHSPFGFVHLTHQNLSARALFCLNSLAKVNTQLLIYNSGAYNNRNIIYLYRECPTVNYRFITAYLLLRVKLDKIMHARWDFDASSARTRRVSALDRHQNWSASALFCLNSRAQSKYAVVNLIHTRRKQTFLSFIMW